MFGSSVNYKNLVSAGAVIIDVRNASEYNAGHISQAKNIPLELLKQSLTSLKTTNKPVITVCRSGMRSGMAAHILAQAGIEVYNGGAWNALEKKIKQK